MCLTNKRQKRAKVVTPSPEVAASKSTIPHTSLQQDPFSVSKEMVDWFGTQEIDSLFGGATCSCCLQHKKAHEEDIVPLCFPAQGRGCSSCHVSKPLSDFHGTNATCGMCLTNKKQKRAQVVTPSPEVAASKSIFDVHENEHKLQDSFGFSTEMVDWFSSQDIDSLLATAGAEAV